MRPTQAQSTACGVVLTTARAGLMFYSNGRLFAAENMQAMPHWPSIFVRV